MHVYSTDRRQIIELRQARASLGLSTTGYAAFGYAIIVEDFGLLHFLYVLVIMCIRALCFLFRVRVVRFVCFLFGRRGLTAAKASSTTT